MSDQDRMDEGVLGVDDIGHEAAVALLLVQKAELDRLLAERRRLNGQVESLIELNRREQILRQREQDLREQLQNTVGHMSQQIAQLSGRVERAEEKLLEAPPPEELANEAEQKMERMLKPVLLEVLTALEKMRAERDRTRR